MGSNSTKSKAVNPAEHISYSDGSVVSKILLKRGASNITLFSFDEGQSLSEHTVPFDAFLQVLDGKAKISIDSIEHEVRKGEFIIMPANVPHSVKAEEKFKMLLTMLKD